MNSIIIVNVCVALMSTIISYGVGENTLLNNLRMMENPNNGNIDNIFKPSEGGLLGRGAYAITYKVRTTKYIHSRGICHNDLKLNNIMFHQRQAFIIDYNSAIDIYAFRKEKKSADPKRDWKCFLFALYPFVCSKPEWLGLSDEDMSEIKNPMAFIDRLLEDATKSEQFSGLRRVFIEFAKYSNKDESGPSKGKGPATISFHDQVYKVITDELKKIGCTYSESPSIATIDGSWGTTKPNFTKDQYEFFSEHYREELIKAGRMFDQKLSSRRSGKFSKLF